MAIIAKHVLEARRAAAASAATAAAQTAIQNAVPAQPPVTSEHGDHPSARAASPALNETELPPDPTPAKRRGLAVKDENGKWQPTSDYPEGFARPPEHSRFKPGCKGGPGRPKGSVSHDALMLKHLRQKREVAINGRRRQVASRELLVMSTLKSALEGKDRQARAYVLAQDQRLHPSKESEGGAQEPATLSASDLLSLAEYEQELREQLRAEIQAEFDAQKGHGR